MSRRRALLLTWEFPPRIVGGIATHVYHLSRSLSRRHFAVDVVTCGFPGAPREEIIDGVRVTRVENDRLPETDFLLWIYRLNSQLMVESDRLLSSCRYELIHAHDWLVGRAATQLKKRHGLPLVTTIHATEKGRGSSSWNGYRRTIHEIERLLVAHSDRVICCSDYMARSIEETLDVPPQRLDVIPNGVDVAKFAAARELSLARDRSAEPQKLTILFVGRLVHEKGVHSLLAAFQDIAAKEPRARLTVVGDGPVRRALTEEAVRRRVHPKVRFEGFVPENRLLDLLGSCDVLVMPSLYEPFGIAALEAWASRIPLVASDVGGLSEIVDDGVTGVKVPPGDIAALSRAILRVLQDPSFAESLRNHAYAAVCSTYDWDGVAAATIDSFERARTCAADDPFAISEGPFLRDNDLLHLLLSTGATEERAAKSAKEIAEVIMAPPAAVKTMLGRQASQGYVCVAGAPDRRNVTYHLTKIGILKACSEFS